MSASLSISREIDLKKGRCYIDNRALFFRFAKRICLVASSSNDQVPIAKPFIYKSMHLDWIGLDFFSALLRR